MRGKVGIEGLTPPKTGITPAYAGKSFNARFTKNDPEDHPRLCGEKWGQLQSNSGNRGSPPPMRGKDDRDLVFCVAVGITPAYAGKSFLLHCSTDKRLGSPPPMRGKVCQICISCR